MKFHELKTGTRFRFKGGDIDYRVTYRGDGSIHYVRFAGEPSYIVTSEYTESWNMEVEEAQA